MIDIMKKFDSVDDGIANMIAAANHDYCDGGRYNDDMVKKFKNGWEIKKGKKYIKLTAGHSAWGFIVNTDDDKKFKKGDLLKWTDYVKEEYELGLFLEMRPEPNMNLAGDVIVLVGDKRINWDGWQCEKLEKGKWTCK